MQSRIGLRTEIIVNVALLMGAALLFTGFLLVKLTERELLAQRIAGVAGTMEILARASLRDQSGDNDAALLAAVTPLMQGLPPGSTVSGWGIVGRELQPLAEHGSSSGYLLEQKPLAQVKRTGDPELTITYPPAWPLFGSPPESDVVVTVPIMRQGMFLGALQARFSLADVRLRVLSAQKWMLLYTLLYGAVLVPFGVYFLSRNVVRPIRRLQTLAQRIAAGDLEQTLAAEGPREIAELAGSFNGMTAALRLSQREREAHIQTLQQTNAELRQMQEELIRSEKMASVGHLAAGMAHEIGNPLGAIVGYLEFLKSEAIPAGEKEIIVRALTETGRIDRLVRELLDYAAPAGSEPLAFDPLTALTEALEILQHQRAFDGLQIDSRLPPGLPPTSMVQHRLVQVFVNLLLNARDASPPGGTIRLAAGEDGGQLWLSVADAGAGIPAEIQAHIFDPFYTTKAPGKGRGLGLAICQRVVGESGGRITVRSQPGAGSEFIVWLRKAEIVDHAV